ncbi:tetratricopeptide repeat protein [Aphanothece sacrum]|nr:tetratricopeptide repeat protein [Aphanothece sacrum]
MLRQLREKTVPKRNSWLFSLIICTGLCQLGAPVMGQALLPYTPPLNREQLQKQGLEWAEEAIYLTRFQQYERALSLAKLASQLAANDYQPWFILGTLYLQQQQVDAGIEALQKALSLAPKEAGIKFTLGNAYFQKGEYQTAVTQLEEGLKLKPNTPAALFDLGNSYLKLGKMTEAIAVYNKAVAQEKNFWPAINNIGLIQYEQGNIKEAIDNWQAAIKLDAEQPEPQLAVAVALYSQGKKEEALKIGETALKSDSRYGDIKFLADNLWGKKLLEDTQKFFTNPQMKAVLESLEPKSSTQINPVSVLNNVGWVER